MRISDWSSDVCSSDLVPPLGVLSYTEVVGDNIYLRMLVIWGYGPLKIENIKIDETPIADFDGVTIETREGRAGDAASTLIPDSVVQENLSILLEQTASRSEEHTSELQSLMRSSYAVFCLKKK